MMRTRRTKRTGLHVLAVGAALAFVLAACGGDDSSSNSSATTAAKQTTSSTSSGSSAQATIAVGQTSLGKTLVDSKGKTIYLFENDKTANMSTCNGACAGTWPAVTTTGALVLGPGLDKGDFATFTRADGTKQVSVYGQPLYTFGPDMKPGDTNGQDFGGVWYAVGANGKKIESASSSETSSTSGTSSSSSGY
jgi:predicted lipoprotein with Yx(FWY)xxD motif